MSNTWTIIWDTTMRMETSNVNYLLSLAESTRDLYNSLLDVSKDSCPEFCENFTAHFTTRKRLPISMTALSGITESKKETMLAYINRFTKVAIAV